MRFVRLRAIPLNTLFDDCLRLFDVTPTKHFSASRFLEVLVVAKVMLELLDELRQILQRRNRIGIVSVIGWRDDDFIIHLAIIFKPHDSDNFCFQPNTGRQRLGTNDKRVQFVAVFVKRLGNKAVIAGFRKNARLYPIEHECRMLAVPFDFKARSLGNLDDSINESFFDASRRQDLVEISHRLFSFTFPYSVAGRADMEKWYNESMLIIGHRGAGGLAPENTIAAFEAGIEADADMLELDVRLTRDGHPVVIHDAMLLRTHHIRRSVSRMTLQELRDITKDAPVPTLREVLDRYFGRIVLNIELKSRGSGVAVLHLLKNYYIKRTSDWDSILLSSFKARELLELRRLSNRVNLSLLHEQNPFLFVAYARRLRLTGVGFHRLHLHRFALEIAKKSGLFTTVYTVDRPATARILEREGYDAIFTNYPDKMARTLSRPH